MTFNWGTGIASVYAVFVLATTAFVTFAMRQPVALVRTDYYAESLRQDQRSLAIRNAGDLGAHVAVVETSGPALLIVVPREQAAIARGNVTFYRASDVSADRVVPLAVAADGRQRISLNGYQAGRWVVQLQWTAGGRDFYTERQVDLK
ncbi:MAG: hypothetical protein V7647_642 [Acidobacteriota bacterium]|jgi:hypothetical protein